MEKYFYICNRKRCENCSGECKHTSDERFAKNPKEERTFLEYRDGSMWEVEQPKTDPEEQDKE